MNSAEKNALLIIYQRQAWRYCQVAIPLFIILLVSPLLSLALGSPYPWGVAFAGGDLLLFSGLLLLAILVFLKVSEMRFPWLSTVKSFGNIFWGSLTLSFCALSGYAVLSFLMLKNILQPTNRTNHPSLDTLVLGIFLNVIVTTMAVFLGNYAFWYTAKHVRRRAP